MCYGVAVLPEYSLGSVRFSGAVNSDAIRQALDALYTHPAWRPGFTSLWDGREIRLLAVWPAAADGLVARLDELAPCVRPGRTAIVVCREVDYLFAWMVMARTTHLPWGRAVFHSLAPAVSWLIRGGGEALSRTNLPMVRREVPTLYAAPSCPNARRARSGERHWR